MKYILYCAFLFCVTKAMDEKESITKKAMCTFKVSLEQHKGSVNQIKFNPANSNELISNSNDGTIKIWNINNSSCTKNLNKEYPNKNYQNDEFAVSSNGKLLAYGALGNAITIINRETLITKKIGDLKGCYLKFGEDSIKKIEFSPKNDAILLSAPRGFGYERPNHITIFNIENDTKNSLSTHEINDFAVEPTQGITVVVGSKTFLKVYDIENSSIVNEFSDLANTNQIVFSAKNPHECMIFDKDKSHVTTYNILEKKPIRSFYIKLNDKPLEIENIAFHSYDTGIVVTTKDQTHIFDAQSGNYIESLPNKVPTFGFIAQKISQKYTKNGNHAGKMLGAVISPDGKTLATHSCDNNIKIWEKN